MKQPDGTVVVSDRQDAIGCESSMGRLRCGLNSSVSALRALKNQTRKDGQGASALGKLRTFFLGDGHDGMKRGSEPSACAGAQLGSRVLADGAEGGSLDAELLRYPAPGSSESLSPACVGVAPSASR